MSLALTRLQEATQELRQQPFHPSRDLALSLANAAANALQEANGALEVKDIRDKLHLLEMWFKKQRAQLVDSNLLVAQRLRTEWELGGELETGGRKPGQRNQTFPEGRSELPPTLKQLGMTEKESHWYRRIHQIDMADRETWIEEKQLSKELSTAGLLRLWAEMYQPESLPMPDPPEGQYRCLVIDPPWPMERVLREGRPLQPRALNYPIMSLEEIAALSIPELGASDGCHLYLWVTQKYLPYGLELVERWGFRYQCLLTWIKPVGVTPFSWMYNTEHVIFARQGDLPLQMQGQKLSFEESSRGHSIKPDIFYERVLVASPEPRLDMFARRDREGFKVWGNEV